MFNTIKDLYMQEKFDEIDKILLEINELIAWDLYMELKQNLAFRFLIGFKGNFKNEEELFSNAKIIDVQEMLDYVCSKYDFIQKLYMQDIIKENLKEN